MVSVIVVIFLVLIIWQVFSKRNSDNELKKIASVTASLIFWGVVLLAIIAAVMNGLK